jgi:predicted secreted protein
MPSFLGEGQGLLGLLKAKSKAQGHPFGRLPLNKKLRFLFPHIRPRTLGMDTTAVVFRRLLLFLPLALALFGSAWAKGPPAAEEKETPLREALSLEATASEEVFPDRAAAVLVARKEGTELSTLAQGVAELVSKALAELKKTPGLQVATGGYETLPRWKTVNNRAERDGWIVQGRLFLESGNFETLGQVLGKWGNELQVESTSYRLSSELQEREEKVLTEKAIQKFLSRAKEAAQALGYRGYRLGKIQLGNLEQAPSGPVPRAYMQAPEAARFAPLPLQAAPLHVSVTVRGTVELQR